MAIATEREANPLQRKLRTNFYEEACKRSYHAAERAASRVPPTAGTRVTAGPFAALLARGALPRKVAEAIERLERDRLARRAARGQVGHRGGTRRSEDEAEQAATDAQLVADYATFLKEC